MWNIEIKSDQFGKCIYTLKSQINCERANFLGTKGLKQIAFRDRYREISFRDYFEERGAIIEYTKSELKKKNKKSLKELCDVLGLKKSGDNTNLIDRILKYQSNFKK